MANGTRLHSVVDTLLVLDAGTTSITASGVGDGGILDIGAHLVHGEFSIEASILDTTTGDEVYTVALEGSNSASFASGIVELASLQMGDTTQLRNQDADVGTGRYNLPFYNEQNHTVYRYVRAYVTAAGTTPILRADMRLTKIKH